MKQMFVYKFISALSIILLLAACGKDESAENISAQSAVANDVIARVGDQDISYSQLSNMLDSSAMVSLSVPELGTPERKTVMLALLDNAINANLIYLDAKKNGTDRLVTYVEDVNRFEEAFLASMYKTNVMIGDVRVSDVDVLHYYNTETDKEAELTDDVKLAIENKIRKQKLDELRSTLRQRLRENIVVVIHQDILSSDYDAKRTDANIVANYDGNDVAWGEVKQLMTIDEQQSWSAAIYIDSDEERLRRLERFIDNAIMTKKGREFGLQKSPAYIKGVAEYRKALLIREHRKLLVRSWNPSEEDLKAYYLDNMDKIALSEKGDSQSTTETQKNNLDDPETEINALRAYMKEKFSDYIFELRNQFQVVVYEDVLKQQFQKEADYIAELGKESEEKGSVTKQTGEESHQWMVKPTPE